MSSCILIRYFVAGSCWPGTHCVHQIVLEPSELLLLLEYWYYRCVIIPGCLFYYVFLLLYFLLYLRFMLICSCWRFNSGLWTCWADTLSLLSSFHSIWTLGLTGISGFVLQYQSPQVCTTWKHGSSICIGLCLGNIIPWWKAGREREQGERGGAWTCFYNDSY